MNFWQNCKLWYENDTLHSAIFRSLVLSRPQNLQALWYGIDFEFVENVKLVSPFLADALAFCDSQIVRFLDLLYKC